MLKLGENEKQSSKDNGLDIENNEDLYFKENSKLFYRPVLTAVPNSNIIKLYFLEKNDLNDNEDEGNDENEEKNNNLNRLHVLTKQFNFGKSEKQTFNSNFRTCQYHNQLMITGGHDFYNQDSKDCFIYNYRTNECKTLQMNTARSFHSSFYLTSLHVLIQVSGIFNKKCEFLDVEKNIWQNFSDVNVWRKDASIIVFQEKFLFIFGGWNCELRQSNNNCNFIEKIEKIKINKNYFDNTKRHEMKEINVIKQNENLFDGKWDMVNLEIMNESIIFDDILRKSSIGVISLGDSKFLLLGGESSEFIEDSFINNLSPGIGAVTKNTHSLVLDLRIKSYGDWEIMVKESFLTKEVCFSFNKQFIKIIKGNRLIYANIDDTEQRFCKIEIKKDGSLEDRYYNL